MRKVKKTKEQKKIDKQVKEATKHTPLHTLALLVEMIEYNILTYFFKIESPDDLKKDKDNNLIKYKLDDFENNVAFDTTTMNLSKNIYTRTINSNNKLLKICKENKLYLDSKSSSKIIKRLAEKEMEKLAKKRKGIKLFVSVDDLDFLLMLYSFSRLFKKSLIRSKEKINNKDYSYLKTYSTLLCSLSNLFEQEVYGYDEKIA